MAISSIGFVCVATREDGKQGIVRKIMANVNCELATYEQFTCVVNSIKHQIQQKNDIVESVVVVRPTLLWLAKSMRDWLCANTATAERHIGVCCIVRDKDDPSFEWPVFIHGYDIKNKQYYPVVLDSYKKICLSLVENMQRDIYIRNNDVHAFASINSPIWTDNFLKLCEKEEVFAASPENYMYFMEAK